MLEWRSDNLLLLSSSLGSQFIAAAFRLRDFLTWARFWNVSMEKMLPWKSCIIRSGFFVLVTFLDSMVIMNEICFYLWILIFSRTKLCNLLHLSHISFRLYLFSRYQKPILISRENHRSNLFFLILNSDTSIAVSFSLLENESFSMNSGLNL